MQMIIEPVHRFQGNKGTERITSEMLGKLRIKTSSLKTWKKFKVKPAIAITKAINAIRIMMFRPFTQNKRGFGVLFFHV